jgi:hypothetical protein
MRSGSLTTCLIKPKAATDSLKDVLIRLARQKTYGSIALDGRKSISKLPMINFSFHAESRSSKENTDIFSTQTLCSKWTRMSGELLGFGEDGTARLRNSCHEPAGLDRLSGAMLESVYEYPLRKRNRLGLERAANLKLICVHYNMRLTARVATGSAAEWQRGPLSVPVR